MLVIPRPLSYVLMAGVAALYLLSALARVRRRRAHELSAESVTAILVKTGLMLVALEAVTFYLNKDRGISAPFVLFLVLVVVMNFLLARTSWGRSVFAVGGSVEAARRAGINVALVRTAAFALCSFTAGVAMLLYASLLGGMSNNVEGGQYVLYAVAAAVIGGTSLFGGRGKPIHGVLGGLVIAGIYNGLYLQGISDVTWQYIVTGVVLLAAVVIDALSRRGAASGSVTRG